MEGVKDARVAEADPPVRIFGGNCPHGLEIAGLLRLKL